MKKVFYIDQQSYSNLSIYDHSLISHIYKENPEFRIEYIGNVKYDYLPMPEGVTLRKVFRYSTYDNALCRMFSYVWSVIRLIFLILTHRPKVVHLQWIKVFQMDYLFLWTAKHLCGSRIVFTAHNILPHNSGESAVKSYGRVYALADTVIVHTETSLSDFQARFPEYKDKAVVIPHGVLPNKYTDQEIAARAEELRKELEIPEGSLTFSMLGYQSYYKGTDIVCNAWNSSEKLAGGSNVLLVAGKASPDAIPAECAANIRVINRFINDIDFLAMLNLTDVLLLPYRAIDQSGLLLTAVHTCTPVCVSRVGELTRPLSVAKVGWTFETLETDDVRNMIEHLADNPSEIAQVKADEQAWKKINDMYGWTESARLTSGIYTRK